MATLSSPVAPTNPTRCRSRSPGACSHTSSLASPSNNSELEDPMPSFSGSRSRTMERMSSHPSLTHSTSSMGTGTSTSEHDVQTENSMSGSILLTPIDKPQHSHLPNVRVAHEDEHSPTDEKRGLKSGLTRSMQSLRGRAVADKVKEQDKRAASADRKAPKIDIPSAPVHKANIKSSTSTSKPTPVSSSTTKANVKVYSPESSRPSAVRSGSSFSNFIRKLTGKSPKPTTPKQETPTTSSSRASTIRPEGSSRPLLAIDTSSPKRGRSERLPSLPAALPVPASRREPAPQTAPPAAPPTRLHLNIPIDPCSVPLPASPGPSMTDLVKEVDLPAAQATSSVDVEAKLPPVKDNIGGPQRDDLTADQQSHITSRPTIRLVKKNNSSSSDVTCREEKEEEDELEDLISPLRSRQLSDSASTARDSFEIKSPATGKLTLEEELQPISPTSILSPVSAISSSAIPVKQIRVASQSPPRKSPGVTSPAEGGLVRKGSKWRRSMMNISENLKPESKRVYKEPPTSFDAYQAHQARLANNRKSCSPTAHTAGTIARDIQEIKDKEEREMAESFFMS